ncbi:MAG: hemolysin III family protein [Oligoflexia bacterium]|nr:hemolysin III family protein [Oligoflexia bacterium]MBF0364444.1 hemolysin III family protein [Oligoflexia bacterium]
MKTKARNIELFRYSKTEERANSVTHLVGLLLSFISMFILLMEVHTKSSLTIFYCLIYSITAMMMFASSFSYHFTTNGGRKYLFKIFDHVSIYLFIAGTYTPIVLIGMKSALAIKLLIAVWILVIFGIIYELLFLGKNRYVSTLFYLLLGNLSIFTLHEMLVTLNVKSVTFLLVGGAIYSLGTIFYIIKKIPYGHAIWHLFVIGGFVTHFLAIYFCCV